MCKIEKMPKLVGNINMFLKVSHHLLKNKYQVVGVSHCHRLTYILQFYLSIDNIFNEKFILYKFSLGNIQS